MGFEDMYYHQESTLNTLSYLEKGFLKNEQGFQTNNTK